MRRSPRLDPGNRHPAGRWCFMWSWAGRRPGTRGARAARQAVGERSAWTGRLRTLGALCDTWVPAVRPPRAVADLDGFWGTATDAGIHLSVVGWLASELDADGVEGVAQLLAALGAPVCGTYRPGFVRPSPRPWPTSPATSVGAWPTCAA
jgi:hypothetical protein